MNWTPACHSKQGISNTLLLTSKDNENFSLLLTHRCRINITGRRNAAEDPCGPDDEEGLPPRQEDRPHGGD